MDAIAGCLEPTGAGPTALWAHQTAREYGCVVSVGYPEVATSQVAIPHAVMCDLSSTISAVITSSRSYVRNLRSMPEKTDCDGEPGYYLYNSTLTVAPDGKILAHYRKTHLYYTDATWAMPSPTGFTSITLPLKDPLPFKEASATDNKDDIHYEMNDTIATTTPHHTLTSFGICMDMNPQYFTASWERCELATHTLRSGASLLLISTAWLTRLPSLGEDASIDRDEHSGCCPLSTASQPDLDSFAYWIDRLTPLLDANHETLVVIANRTGVEPGTVRSCDLENPPRPSFSKPDRTLGDSPLDPEKQNRKEEVESHIGAEPAAPSGPRAPRTSSEEVNQPVDTDGTSNIMTTSAHYAGTSSIFALGHGRVRVWGLMGRGGEGVSLINTEAEAESIWTLKPKKASMN